MDNSLISICIPAYEMGGNGSKCLRQLLQTVEAQDYKNYEVIISDHSQNDSILEVANSFNNGKIKHYYNDGFRGSSSGNVNYAISKATGNKIKVMFQDDFFVNRSALSIASSLLDEYSWGVSACIHYKTDTKEFFRPHFPYWQDDIKKGNNTIGGPSVMFYNKCDLKFDTNLLWYMDIDFYYRLYKIYGEPYIENKTLIGIREDNSRVSSTYITEELVNRENKIIRDKFLW